MSSLQFVDLGLVDYQKALQLQLKTVDEVFQNQSEGVIYFCTHPAIVTLGRKTKPEDVFAWTGPTLEVSRGGRATYHGPSQLVVYPIINLKKLQPPQDIGFFIRTLEDAFVQLVNSLDIQATGKSFQKNSDSDDSATGVWVNEKKIASLGIAIKNWVSYHGVALNVEHDETAFSGMNPCGYQKSIMTDLESQLGKILEREVMISFLKEYFSKNFIF